MAEAGRTGRFSQPVSDHVPRHVGIRVGRIGQNYQIEHHLFPNMSRPNLRRAQALVRQYCRERQIPYTRTSLLDSYRLALRHLHTVAR